MRYKTVLKLIFLIGQILFITVFAVNSVFAKLNEVTDTKKIIKYKLLNKQHKFRILKC